MPQAVRLRHDGHVDIYSPAPTVARLVQRQQIKVRNATVAGIVQGKGGRWHVRTFDGRVARRSRASYDVCVLAASPIGNNQLLADLLDRPLTEQISDHPSVGLIARATSGEALGPALHPKLWTGYRREPELGMNLFVQEMEPAPDGARMLDLCAVIDEGDTELSTVHTEPARDGGLAKAHVVGRLPAVAQQRMERALGRLRELAELAADTSIVGPMPVLSYEAALAVVRRKSLIAAYIFDGFQHETMSHSMGTAPGHLVRPDLRVQEPGLGIVVPGVYAVGAGVFPRIGAANPALTIMAVSRALPSFIA